MTDSPADELSIQDNPDQHRYELVRGDDILSVLLYDRREDHTVIPHVETRPDHRGNDYGATLVLGVLDIIRDEGGKVYPTCGFAARTIRENPAYHDLLV